MRQIIDIMFTDPHMADRAKDYVEQTWGHSLRIFSNVYSNIYSGFEYMLVLDDAVPDELLKEINETTRLWFHEVSVNALSDGLTSALVELFDQLPDDAREIVRGALAKTGTLRHVEQARAREFDKRMTRKSEE